MGANQSLEERIQYITDTCAHNMIQCIMILGRSTGNTHWAGYIATKEVVCDFTFVGMITAMEIEIERLLNSPEEALH